MAEQTRADFVSEIRKSLMEYISKAKESQSKVANELGVSKTVLSLFLGGTYTGNNGELVLDRRFQNGFVPVLRRHLHRQQRGTGEKDRAVYPHGHGAASRGKGPGNLSVGQ